MVQILKYTDDEHADHELLNHCTEKAEKVLAKTNESIREQEDEERLAMLSDKLKMAGVEDVCLFDILVYCSIIFSDHDSMYCDYYRVSI